MTQAILDVPDSIPQERLEKAGCVIVIPYGNRVHALPRQSPRGGDGEALTEFRRMFHPAIIPVPVLLAAAAVLILSKLPHVSHVGAERPGRHV